MVFLNAKKTCFLLPYLQKFSFFISGSSDDLPPFSPGMFLNEVGEPSTEKDLDSEDNSLLSYSKE